MRLMSQREDVEEQRLPDGNVWPGISVEDTLQAAQQDQLEIVNNGDEFRCTDNCISKFQKPQKKQKKKGKGFGKSNG